jgi:hypothetical protein
MGQDQLMNRTPARLIALVLLLGVFGIACVGVNDSAPKAQPKAEQPAQPKSDSGFTVGETAVPTTPEAPKSGDGYTVNETAVPNK